MGGIWGQRLVTLDVEFTNVDLSSCVDIIVSLALIKGSLSLFASIVSAVPH